MVLSLVKQVGSDCTRFLFTSCVGWTIGWKEATCAQEGSSEFVRYALGQELFHLVKCLHNDKLEAQIKMVVTNFFVKKGALIISSKPDDTEKVRTWLVKTIHKSYSRSM